MPRGMDINDLPVSYSFVAAAAQVDFAIQCRVFAGYEDAFVVTVNGVTLAYNAAPLSTSQFKVVAAGGGLEGGTVTIGAPLAGGEAVVIRRQLPLERLTDFPTVGPVSIADLNAELSRFIALIQDVYAGFLPNDYNLVSGAWAPVASNLANCSGITFSKAYYQRVGAIVTCTMLGTLTVTTAGVITQFRTSLPFPSALVASSEVIGVGVHQSGDAFPMGVDCSQGDDKAQVTFYPATNGARGFKIQFQYEVK